MDIFKGLLGRLKELSRIEDVPKGTRRVVLGIAVPLMAAAVVAPFSEIGIWIFGLCWIVVGVLLLGVWVWKHLSNAADVLQTREQKRSFYLRTVFGIILWAVLGVSIIGGALFSG
ncbi:MAG TPA: hypothetical protein VIL71_23665 [Spirillospora sp.]